MLDAAIERKSLRLTLVSTSNIRIAHRAVKLIAQGKTFGDIETVSVKRHAILTHFRG